MKRIADFSIRSKITFIVMTTTCAALCVAMVAMGVFDTFAVRAQLRRDAVTNARVIANNSITALSSGDEEAATETLNALAVNPHLGVAALYDGAGTRLAAYRRPGWQTPAPLKLTGNYVNFNHDQIEVAEPVLRLGQRVGTVFLQVDLSDLRKRQWLSAATAGLVLLLAAGLSYLLTMRWQRFIATPIQNLAAASNVVATEKNYGVRVVKHANDELGQLVDGFNSMLAQIETRDKALREAHAELEHRVGDRTRDLFQANQQLHTEVSNHKRAREESDALRERLQAAYEKLQREAAERNAMQEELQGSEERFSKAFRSSPVAQAILTRTGRVFVDVNERFAELAGVTPEALIGSPLFGVPLWAVPETRARIEQLLADGHSLRNWACRITGADDKPRQALLSAETLQLGDEPCVLLMTEDVSERVSLEGQLRQAQKMEAIGQLAAGVAHDFNNLLTVIQGYTQLLLALAPAGNMGREPLEKIIAATQRASGLTSQLLTFSRKQVAQPKAVDLNKVVGSVTGMLRPLLGENIRLQLRPAASLPAIMADAAMLEQVLVNLAVNARDAMPRGGELIVSTFPTEIDATYAKGRAQASAGPFVCLQVSDSGMGMDPATMERIFEPFFTTKGVGKGTGLGLATVYGIVKQHRGWVEVVSQIGVGTTFKVFLPAVPAVVNQTEFIQNPDVVRGGHETILVVEDEPALRELVTKVLRNYGYQVLEAAHGKEALRVWQGLPRKPALLLTDMMMPEGMTGWELAEQIRGETPEVKVLFTSGYSPEIFGTDVQLDERANFLPKPYHPRVLARTVRSCLDNERPERPQPILP
jgi:PAS domain S-box-containing protein